MKNVPFPFAQQAVRLAALPAALILLLGLLPSQSAVFDFSALLRDVLLTQNGNTIYYRIYDPAKVKFVSQQENSGNIANLNTRDGLVYWSDGVRVFARIYDPAIGKWIKTEVATGAVSGLTSDSGIVTWISQGFVYTLAYDCSRSKWMSHRNAFTGTPDNLQTRNGHVAWKNQSAAFYSVYDPMLGKWVTDLTSSGAPPIGLDIKDGVVHWHNGSTVYARVYDPRSGDWKGRRTNSGQIRHLTSAGGAVAWANQSAVFCTIYDPIRDRWISAEKDSGNTTNLTVSAGTVRWTSGVPGEDDFIRGYDSEEGSWGSHVTTPLPYFTAHPAMGDSPLKVYFIDMSIGAAGWGWDFGDEQISFRRSPLHTYSSTGIRRARLAITDPNDRGNTRTMSIFVGSIEATGAGGGATLDSVRFDPTQSLHVVEGVFQAVITGEPGQLVVIECSTNLKDWQPVATLTNESGSVEFIDSNADRNSNRYYRVRTMAP